MVTPFGGSCIFIGKFHICLLFTLTIVDLWFFLEGVLFWETARTFLKTRSGSPCWWFFWIILFQNYYTENWNLFIKKFGTQQRVRLDEVWLEIYFTFWQILKDRYKEEQSFTFCFVSWFINCIILEVEVLFWETARSFLKPWPSLKNDIVKAYSNLSNLT